MMKKRKVKKKGVTFQNREREREKGGILLLFADGDKINSSRLI